MTRVQRALFPAMLVCIVLFLGVIRLISNPQVVLAANDIATQPPKTGNPPVEIARVQPTPVQPEVIHGLVSNPTPAAKSSQASSSTKQSLSNTNADIDPLTVSVTIPPKNNQPQANGCSLSNLYPDSIRQWCGIIEKYASQNGLEPGLVAALITQESGGDPNAYSGSGAVGLMQVMPSDGLASSFQCVSGPCFSERPTSSELLDPEYNIAYGTRMLAALIQKYGSLREALKYYGPLDVGYYYADLVLGIFRNHP